VRSEDEHVRGEDERVRGECVGPKNISAIHLRNYNYLLTRRNVINNELYPE